MSGMLLSSLMRSRPFHDQRQGFMGTLVSRQRSNYQVSGTLDPFILSILLCKSKICVGAVI